MAKKKQGPRIKIILECTEAKDAGVPVSRYATKKNRRNTTARLELMKYNKNLGRHTLHREIK
jgi:large subunit ribosomal protein L33